MKYILIIFCLVFGAEKSEALNDTLSLQGKIQSAELVFEGRVISDSSFWNFNETAIYTIKYVLVTKEFKGNFTTDTVKIIRQESGATVGGVIQQIKDNGSLVLYNGTEGIFFCQPMSPELFMQIKGNGIYQINLRYNCDGFIGISCLPKMLPNMPRASSCDGMSFDDIKKELYEPIEKITGKDYRQLRQNCLEQNKPRK